VGFERSGIGYNTSRKLAENGAKVALLILACFGLKSKVLSF